MSPQVIGIILVILAGLFIVGGLVFVGMRENSDRDPMQMRLAEYADREVPASLEEIEMSLSFQERVVVPTLKALATIVTRFAPEAQLEQTRKMIELAGKAQKTDARSFFAQRILMTVVFGGGAFLLFGFVNRQPPLTLLGYVAGAAVLGYYLPVMSLRSQITRRQQGILRALPDALDLLTICVEAGLGFDAAMGKVYEKWDNDLSMAFGRVLQEIQLGKLRREALRDMAQRMEVPDVTTFTAAIIQADQLGVSIAKILRVQSDQMRVKRRQRAQEKAHQAPVKMIIPMVFLIFPSIWIVLLGPSVIVLRRTTVPL